MLKKLKFHPGVWIIFFVILSILGTLVVRGNKYCELVGEYNSYDYKKCFIGSDEYNVKNNQFEAIGEDPKLIFDFTKIDNTGVSGIVLKLKDEIKLSDVQVYYGFDGQNYSEATSRQFSKGKSKNIEITSLQKFQFLRIDIDTDFEITGLEISKDVTVKKVSNIENYILVFVCSLIIAFLLSLINNINDFITRIIKVINLYCGKIKKKKWLIMGTVFLVVIEFVAVVIFEKLMSSGHEHINEPRLLSVFGMIFVVSVSVLYRKYILKYIHLYFLVILMVIGSVHIIATPPITGTSFDDEIHYSRSAYVSWLCSGEFSNADYMIQNYYGALYEREVYSFEGRSEWVKDINGRYDSYGNGVLITDVKSGNEFSWCYVAYVPTAMALAIGRGLGLSFTYTFMLGKFANLLLYGIMFAISIYLIKSKGKILLALIGLIPTSVFMACSYSYDWWLIGCAVLGYSIFFSTLQQGKTFSVKKYLLITGILVLGILTKAVYFPLLLPMMVLKKDKYQNSKLCRMITVFAIIFLISTFITPILFGTKEGDSRGGEGIDAMGQVSFILTNPLQYSKILLNFIKTYISLEEAHKYLTYMAYLGQLQYTRMCILILGVAGVIDNRKNLVKDKCYKIRKIIFFFSAFATVVLVATALYVSYTPVGHHTINGCQPRYLLPMFFPLIYYFGDIGLDVSNQIKNSFTNIAICIMSLIFLYGTYTQLAIFY
ncbi:MAG: DUF2142 domain-containing protein [Lachnospiraceae bacterium]|nr:DUF2142 domain-containing protein [Lachnospiraceae bacterium]